MSTDRTTGARSPAPAIVTPLDEHMGLDIARSLSRRGIPVYGVDSDPNVPGRFSKHIRFLHSPDPLEDEGAFVQYLVDLGHRLATKAVLYPLSDRDVLIASRHRSVLQEYYEYVMPDHRTMERLTTKDGLRAVAQEMGILSPRTLYVDSNGNTIAEIAERVTYPVILKPTESTYWHSPELASQLRRGLLSGRAKVVRCDTPEDLKETYQRIAAHDSRLVVQEVVPGEDSRLVYFSFYLDSNSTPLAIFAGRKIRVMPTQFGSASYVRSFYDEELKKTALDLLSGVGYQGLGGLEFKRDPRGEVYRLIEFNTRFGMWDGLGAVCGVDLAYIAYRDALHLPVKPQFDYRQDVIWVDWQRDLRAALEYRRKGELTFGEWLQSLRGEKMWAIYSREDWRPGAAFTTALFRTLWSRLATIARRH